MNNVLQAVRKSEKLRGSAERQVVFNEALRRAVEDKDRRIGELEAELRTLQGGRGQAASDLETQLAEVSGLVKQFFIRKKMKDLLNLNYLLQEERAAGV